MNLKLDASSREIHRYNVQFVVLGHIFLPRFFAKTSVFSLEIQQNAFFFTNRAAGGQAQVLRDVNCDSKSSEHGVNRAPSRVVPEVDDIPRPVHRPLF